MIGGEASCRPMDGAGGAVPLLCPRFNLEKLILEIFAGAAEKGLCSPFSIFHMQPAGRISRESHGRSVSVRSTDGLVHFEDVQFSGLRVFGK